MNTPPLPMVLTSFGLPHVMGYIPTQSGTQYPDPLGVVGLMDAAVELGLAGIGVPLPAPETMSVEAFRDALAERGLRVNLETGSVLDMDVESFREYLTRAAFLGSNVVRSVISGVLCGDRRKLEGGWEAKVQATAKRLNDVLPYTEDLGICLALENHQDATSADLLRLAEMVNHSPAFGVTLDAGNPLAVGEGPVEFAGRIAHLIRHIHLKDYTIHFAPEGYRLVRCAAGDGVVDFPEILRIVRANGHAVLPGIEIAAQATRTIPLLEQTWWDEYPPREAPMLVEALRVLWAKGRPAAEPYSSAWERGEDSAAVSAEEWDIVRRSVAYFRGL